MTDNIRKLLFFFLLIGVFAVAWRYMIRPANQSLAKQKVLIEANMAKLAELDKARAAIKDMDAKLTQLQDGVTFFESKLPPSSEVHKILRQVAVIAQKQGLDTKTIRTLKQIESAGALIEQPLRMELHGDFDSFYSFLLELEKLPRITKVRELELTKDNKANGLVNAKFVVSIFFQENVS